MWGIRLLAAYAIGLVIGAINEYVQKPKQECFMKKPPQTCALTYGGSNVYGWSLVVLTLFLDMNERHLHLPAWLCTPVIAASLAGLECVMGQVSMMYFKTKKWEYPTHYVTACDGYISVLSTAYFAVGGLAYWKLLYNPLIKNI
jgi:hypothetical protein